ncbi:hypothetical protein [uncultured Thiodictyon sp.]|uniref:hypothetical protein n=1 Tax=uncultured Thiodictyon sp. TaxID=1846217 RepID=UPI0025E05EEB|nr:hypothetical protein [uncultured Thiodictyon sp.]
MAILLAGIALPSGLRWPDEFSADPVAQSMRRRLDGAPTIYARANQAGRPITLEADASQWLTRVQALAVQALAAVPGGQFPLVFEERADLSFHVCFRHHEPPALDLRPLIDYADPGTDDPYTGTIKLMTL